MAATIGTVRYLLIDEAAQIARTSPSTVRHWIRSGRLPSSRPGRRRLIAAEDLERFIRSGVAKQDPEAAGIGPRADNPLSGEASNGA